MGISGAEPGITDSKIRRRPKLLPCPSQLMAEDRDLTTVQYHTLVEGTKTVDDFGRARLLFQGQYSNPRD
jgi:hypothetical protein